MTLCARVNYFKCFLKKKTNLNFIVSIYFIFIAIINGSLQDYVRTFDPPPCTSRLCSSGSRAFRLARVRVSVQWKTVIRGTHRWQRLTGKKPRLWGRNVDCSVKCNSEREVKWIWMKGGFRFTPRMTDKKTTTVLLYNCVCVCTYIYSRHHTLQLAKYIYIYIYVCMCVYLYIYIYIYIYIYRLIK